MGPKDNSLRERTGRAHLLAEELQIFIAASPEIHLCQGAQIRRKGAGAPLIEDILYLQEHHHLGYLALHLDGHMLDSNGMNKSIEPG